MEFEIRDLPVPCRIRFDETMTDAALLRFGDGNEMLWIERKPDGYVDGHVGVGIVGKLVVDLDFWWRWCGALFSA